MEITNLPSLRELCALKIIQSKESSQENKETWNNKIKKIVPQELQIFIDESYKSFYFKSLDPAVADFFTTQRLPSAVQYRVPTLLKQNGQTFEGYILGKNQ